MLDFDVEVGKTTVEGKKVASGVGLGVPKGTSTDAEETLPRHPHVISSKSAN